MPDQVDAEAGAEAGAEEFGGDDWYEAPAVPQWWGVTAFVLSLLGFGDALYLTIEHFNGTVPICAASGVINCAKVTTSPQSYFLHIPVALLGLLFFAAMIVVNVPPVWRSRHEWVAWVRLAMVSAGLVSVICLVSAEVFTIKAVCLWCTGVHVISVVLFILVLATFPAVLQAARAWEGADGDEA